jgi:hypothetical protein
MTPESLVNRDWKHIVDRRGGAAGLETSAGGAKAFLRAQVIENAGDFLRMILAYCLGEKGRRSTAAWGAAIGLVDISNVARLYRLGHRLGQCGDWLALLAGPALACGAPPQSLTAIAVPKAADGRLIRIIDGPTVPKIGAVAKTKNRLWRIHSAFDLPAERFGCFA